MPTISIIIPVYKAEPYLRRCVDSVLSQTYTDFEIILVDDGSPDSCPQICDEYAALDSRVRVIHQENGGPSVARNAGMKVARGEYLTFIDSDDYVSYAYLECLWKNIEKYNADISACGMTIFDGSALPDVENELTHQNINEFTGVDYCRKMYDLQKNISVAPWAKLYRREVIVSPGFPEGKAWEDQGTIPIAAHKARIVVSSDYQGVNANIYLSHLCEKS